MSKYYENAKLLIDSLETDAPLAVNGATAKVLAIAEEVDKRLDFLKGEPNSPNAALASVEAHRLALEKVGEIRSTDLAKLERHRDAAKEKLLARPAVEDHARAQSMWAQVATMKNADPTMIAMSWHAFPPELRTALLTAPPTIRENGDGMLAAFELVDDDTRLSEMSARLPREAAQFNGLERNADALNIVLNSFQQDLEGKR